MREVRPLLTLVDARLYAPKELEERLDEVEDPEVDIPETVVASLEAARVRRNLRSLPMLERRVLVWRYGIGCEQLSCRRVAARLGVSAATVVNMERRALDRLRRVYGELPDAA